MSGSEEALELSEDLSRRVLSPKGEILTLIRSVDMISARARGNMLFLSGAPAKIELIKQFIRMLTDRLATDNLTDDGDVKRLFHECTETPTYKNGEIPDENSFEEIIQTHTGRPVRSKTQRQRKYVEAVRNFDITVSIGPAGTGKTYLAIAMAVKALREKRVSRLILSRPTIEAGEKLGYLPGDVLEKVDPHFRPLYDALQEFLGISRFQQLLRQNIIEITPLAYMRGRTFNEAFIVLDEAQNTTARQMKMFLTRMGYGSKMVITGDRTQVDLPDSQESSLHRLRDIIGTIEDIAFIDLCEKDVIRNELVKEVIKAYDRYYKQEEAEK